MRKPYSQPPKKVAWRLMNAGSSNNTTVEIIPHSKYSSSTINYEARVIKQPDPIILEDQDPSETINGINVETQCELNEAIHRDILNRAVDIAKKAYVGDVNAQAMLDQRSE